MKTINANYFLNERGPNMEVRFFTTEKGIVKTELIPHNGRGLQWRLIGEIRNEFLITLIQTWIESYCKRRQPQVILPILLDKLPPYTTQVLSILRDIPFGISLSYQELAEITGNGKGARAVGNACSRNPFPLVVPCHRILGTDSSLVGFSAGIAIKKNLLDFEKIAFKST